MAGSQLKRLKASLKEQGIIGPQQSKKQKRKNAQDVSGRNEKRLQRGVVLSGIREQFNPFDLKHAKGPKFEVTSNVSNNKRIHGRPGEAKAASEEKRRNTLLVDMQRRNKVGGILDRRFGENDPTMAPEDKMLERFALEKQRSHKKNALFDLEEDEPIDSLTHGGKSLSFEDDDGPMDDFEEDDLDYDSDMSERQQQRLKRLRSLAAMDQDDEENDQPERKKSKKEVMEEIIAKSKMHKYERQAAKEDDEELRVQLDKELSNVTMLLASTKANKRTEDPSGNTIVGLDRDAFNKNFDLQVKKLALDARAKPADRTKTEEEIADEESTKLKELEEKRQKRMRGEKVSDSDDSDDDKSAPAGNGADEDDEDEEDFGLGDGIKAKTKSTATELGFDDEDDFIIDDDLVASGSDLELIESDDDESDGESNEGEEEEDDEEDDEFTRGLLNEEKAKNPVFKATSTTADAAGGDEHGLPFTFPCPESLEEFVDVISKYNYDNIPKIVQRIRALYHPKLDSKNKERLGNFAATLIDFISSDWDAESSPSFVVFESIIRHIHSLSKMFPIEIAKQFRQHIEDIGDSRPLALEPADLMMLTAVGTIYPTSDHFHQVVTPAMLTMGRYLGQRVPRDLSDYATGSYLSILALHYQQLSKRYVPEVVNFTLNTLQALAPAAAKPSGGYPIHTPPAGCRLAAGGPDKIRRLAFADCVPQELSKRATAELQVSILATALDTVDAAADSWTGKPAFVETFSQALIAVKHLVGKSCRDALPASLATKAEKLTTKLNRMLKLAELSRRPLELHHHRPLAIKTFIPKFEETFDPDKHYDPDRERAELAKLKKEHKKERKGAMRELRKDANFMAREKLRVKKAKDEAYEKKFKRLVAEIQSEEGRESNAYEREKEARKKARSRMASNEGDEDDDYMNMTFDDPGPAKESSLQRTQRLKRESRARGVIKSKAQLAEESEAAREKALSTSLLDDERAKKSKGLSMMAKMGFTGGGLGKKNDDGESRGRAEPIRVNVKDDRGGIGMDSEKKRKLREAAEEHGVASKAAKVDPDEYRDRVRKEREDVRLEQQFLAAQRLAESMEEEDVTGEKEKVPLASRPLKSVNVLYRGLVKHRHEQERSRRMRHDLEQSLSRLPTYEDDDEDTDYKKALGKTVTQYVEADDLDEADPELDEFDALQPGERLEKVLGHLRKDYLYCFWCKMKYPDASMEGCPGPTEEDHD